MQLDILYVIGIVNRMRPYKKSIVPYISARVFLLNSIRDAAGYPDTVSMFIQSYVEDVTWWQLRKSIMNSILYNSIHTMPRCAVVLKELSK